ncbi:MFS transporter [Chryseobacterium potabilaquae]|uniref:Multidrug resistance protein MdtH n=1 Tax=Chryseobacterium potabilaquae TaxID=2675057 RepID=A0A6N4X6E4_9FLAO|nr:MFS transporter [Chryseobacterium potabilaquae]CAA7194795.1 Multidrug resistance protein MdtH [Chryseobacterium potabilaquae]
MNRIFNFFISPYKGLAKESWMLSVVMLVYRSGSMVLPFLGVYLTEKLGFSLKETGTLLSFYGLGAILGSYLGGKMVDKMGYFKVQIVSLFLCIPGLLLIPEIKNFHLLSIILFLQSTFSEIFLPANSVAITKYSSLENRARAFSLNRLALNLGFFIGPFLGGILSSVFYNLIFYVNAIAAFISGSILYLFFKDKIKTTSKNNDTISQNKHSPYKDKYFLIFILFCVVYAVCLMQLFSTLPLFYKNVGLSKIEIGMIFGYCGLLLFMIEMPLVKWLTKVLNIIHIVILGLFLLFTGYFILVFFSDIYLILISITCISISNILVIPFLSTITSIRAEGKNIGSYMGLFGAIFSTALFISPFLGTFLAQNYGFRSLWLVVCILIIISITGIYFTYTKKLTNSI